MLEGWDVIQCINIFEYKRNHLIMYDKSPRWANHAYWIDGKEDTVFSKTRGHLLVWAPPRLASSGLAWPCLAMPCHALSCLAWVWMWRFFVKYKKWDSYSVVVLMRFLRYLQSDLSRLITIWAIYIYFLIFWAKTSFYKRYLLMAWYLVYPMILGHFQIARLMPGKYGGHSADGILKLILFIKNVV